MIISEIYKFINMNNSFFSFSMPSIYTLKTLKWILNINNNKRKKGRGKTNRIKEFLFYQYFLFHFHFFFLSKRIFLITLFFLPFLECHKTCVNKIAYIIFKWYLITWNKHSFSFILKRWKKYFLSVFNRERWKKKKNFSNLN